jgi:hypothetical protein
MSVSRLLGRLGQHGHQRLHLWRGTSPCHGAFEECRDLCARVMIDRLAWLDHPGRIMHGLPVRPSLNRNLMTNERVKRLREQEMKCVATRTDARFL